MTLHDLTPFEALLTGRGYKREQNTLVLGRAEQHWWKGFWTKGQEYRDYTVCFRVYDRSGYPGYDVERFGRWGVEYRMTVNHQTEVDVELATLDVLHDSMTVEEWERRCAVVWKGMLNDAPARRVRSGASIVRPEDGTVPQMDVDERDGRR